MNQGMKWVLALALFMFAVPLCAADVLANASRDAARLVSCMKAFDAACANSLTYTNVLEEHGISRSQLDQAVTNLYGNMKSTHAAYSRFDMEAPWSPFATGGRSYIFVPYSAVLEGNGRKLTAKAFFIGVSEDGGVSWRFVDGQQITQDTIGHVIPGYVGKLPEREVSQTIPDTAINKYVFELLGIEGRVAERAAEHVVEQAINHSISEHMSHHSSGGGSGGSDAGH